LEELVKWCILRLPVKPLTRNSPSNRRGCMTRDLNSLMMQIATDEKVLFFGGSYDYLYEDEINRLLGLDYFRLYTLEVQHKYLGALLPKLMPITP